MNNSNNNLKIKIRLINKESLENRSQFLHWPIYTNKIYKLKLNFRLLQCGVSKIDGEIFSLVNFNQMNLITLHKNKKNKAIFKNHVQWQYRNNCQQTKIDTK